MDAFEKFDKNKDGSLGLKEIQRLVEALNVSMSPGQVKKKFKVSTQETALNSERIFPGREGGTPLGNLRCGRFRRDGDVKTD